MRGVKGFFQIYRSEGWFGVLFDLMRKPWGAYLRYAESKQLPVVKSAYGIELSADYGDATFRYCVTGKYGLFLAQRIRAVQTPFIFVDIGANQGVYSLVAAANNKALRVYAFEPIHATANRLRENVRINDQAERVQVIEAAISSNDGSQTMAVSDGHTGQAKIVCPTADCSEKFGQQIVASISGDTLSSLIEPAGAPIYVKIDVEGHESTVIDAILNAEIGTRIREIFFEMDENWTDRSVLEDRFQRAGFSLTSVGNGDHYDMLAVRAVAKH